MGPAVVLAEGLTVIRGEDDHRVVEFPQDFEPVEQPAEARIVGRDLGVVELAKITTERGARFNGSEHESANRFHPAHRRVRDPGGKGLPVGRRRGVGCVGINGVDVEEERAVGVPPRVEQLIEPIPDDIRSTPVVFDELEVVEPSGKTERSADIGVGHHRAGLIPGGLEELGKGPERIGETIVRAVDTVRPRPETGEDRRHRSLGPR